ncbi:8-oxo-dGTP diphosphatase MutT [Aliikangiella marina]|uniref:8-oxo-dGTP diphosphatase n=1 Tax=Aliikangiella marina TaxID=1712262 RepID=A0A545TDH8_9GAMM|nr:8-oxo-dGTP diphosphatase MutT [Aliikangiella marina]TQV75265.1 8-oxo-dGTP diphosphatase MutT [Aliikangiella marina]
MKHIQVVAAVIVKNDHVLIARRPLDKHKGGYWEFPGGKIETGESHEEALVREIAEEINIRIEAPQLFERIDFDYPEKSVSLNFFLTEAFSGEPEGLEGQAIKWVAWPELANYQFPEANQPVVKKLQNWFSEKS